MLEFLFGFPPPLNMEVPTALESLRLDSQVHRNIQLIHFTFLEEFLVPTLTLGTKISRCGKWPLDYKIPLLAPAKPLYKVVSHVMQLRGYSLHLKNRIRGSWC